MNRLYHGSGFKQTELKPGFMHTGVEVKWDKTESNKWLYATTVMGEAVALGFASVIEKKYKLDRYQFKDDTVTIAFTGVLPTIEELGKLDVYLYHIAWEPGVWVQVNNRHNKLINEYKTQAVIPSERIVLREKVDLKDWLSRKKVKIVPSNATLNW